MPAVPIKDLDQYEKAIGVLTRVGGTWQGIGQEEWLLLVNESQYRALIDSRVIDANDLKNGQHRGQDSRKTAKP